MEVWIGLLLAIAILPLIQWMLFQSIWKFRDDMEQDHSRNSLFRQFYCVFSVLTSQCNCLIIPNKISNKKKFVTAGIQMPFVGHAPRLLAAIWGSSAVIFVYVYVGTLVSFLSVPKLQPVVDSLEDLQGGHVNWGVRRGSITQTLFTVIPFKLNLIDK
jgi:uncharacterized membrane protein YjgN (DUF898 family)